MKIEAWHDQVLTCLVRRSHDSMGTVHGTSFGAGEFEPCQVNNVQVHDLIHCGKWQAESDQIPKG